MTHRVQVPATVELKNGQLLAQATFPVAPADYNIEIPLLVRNSIAKVMQVRVSLACAPVAGAVGAATPPERYARRSSHFPLLYFAFHDS